MKLTFFSFYKEVVLQQLLQDLADMFHVFRPGFGEDENVINVNKYKITDEIS